MFENTVVVDCRGHLLGRLCSIIAKELMAGQRVVLVRCEEMNISGRYDRTPPQSIAHSMPQQLAPLTVLCTEKRR